MEGANKTLEGGVERAEINRKVVMKASFQSMRAFGNGRIGERLRINYLKLQVIYPLWVSISLKVSYIDWRLECVQEVRSVWMGDVRWMGGTGFL